VRVERIAQELSMNLLSEKNISIGTKNVPALLLQAKSGNTGKTATA
jgi:hypothetical protein